MQNNLKYGTNYHRPKTASHPLQNNWAVGPSHQVPWPSVVLFPNISFLLFLLFLPQLLSWYVQYVQVKRASLEECPLFLSFSPQAHCPSFCHPPFLSSLHLLGLDTITSSIFSSAPPLHLTSRIPSSPSLSMPPSAHLIVICSAIWRRTSSRPPHTPSIPPLVFSPERRPLSVIWGKGTGPTGL